MPAYKTFASYAEKLQKALQLIEEGKVKQAVTQIKKVQASAEKRGSKVKSSKKSGAKRPPNKYMQYLSENRAAFAKANPKLSPAELMKKMAAEYNKVKDSWQPSGKAVKAKAAPKKAAAPKKEKAAPKKAAPKKEKAADKKKPGRPKKTASFSSYSSEASYESLF